MAKKSSIAKNNQRRELVARQAAKRAELKAQIMDKDVDAADRFEAAMKLAELPRNGSKTRIRNRCELTGRPRAVYSKFGLGRNMLRKATMNGDVPGLRKASW